MARPANLPGTERKANRASKRGADLQRRFSSVGGSAVYFRASTRLTFWDPSTDPAPLVEDWNVGGFGFTPDPGPGNTLTHFSVPVDGTYELAIHGIVKNDTASFGPAGQIDIVLELQGATTDPASPFDTHVSNYDSGAGAGPVEMLVICRQFVALATDDLTLNLSTNDHIAMSQLAVSLRLMTAPGPAAAFPAVRVIAGTIEGGSGTVLNGSGFTCSAQSGSDYTVTFDAALAAVPVVLAGHGGGASVVVDPTTSVPAWGASTTGFSVTSTDADDWSFVAVVP